MWVACKTVYRTRAIPERLRDEQLILNCYTNKADFTFTFSVMSNFWSSVFEVYCDIRRSTCRLK